MRRLLEECSTFTLFLSLALLPPALRVCADPANLPYSNRAMQGFENRIAEQIAADLHMRLQFVWIPQGKRLVRNTLDAARCDVLPGIPREMPGILATAPYYRSTYVFVTLPGAVPHPRNFDDPALRRLRIGVQIVGDEYAPPAAALARRGIIRNIKGYSAADSPFAILDALAHKEIDVAIVWGPIAGFYAKRSGTGMEIRPVPPQPGPVPMQFSISFGVARGNQELRQQLDAALSRERESIRSTLARFGVPLI
jgi:mxaJ protein